MSDFVSAALLAGGSSKRMGLDKQFFHISGVQMFEQILPTLSSIFDDVMVVTDSPELYKNMDVRTVSDIIPGSGPLSGIHTAIVESRSKYVYILACDMPVINVKYIDFMIDKLIRNPSDACVTRKGNWIEPFHAFYSKTGLPTFEADFLESKGSIYYILKRINTLYIPESDARKFTPDWFLFCNLNTPEDYLHYTGGHN